MLKTRLSLAACVFVSLGLGVASCGEDDDPTPPDDGGPKCEERGECGGAGGAGGGSSASCDGQQFELEFRGFSLGTNGVTDFRFLPGNSGKFLLTASSGTLYLGKVSGDSVTVSKHWEIPDTVVPTEACGLTNLLLDPEFSDNGFIYVTYCTDYRRTHLVRYTWSEADGLSDKAQIFVTELPKRTDEWHRFGSMGFEEDGETLWMLVGDHFISEHGQTLDDPYGSLIRIVPNREVGGSGYEIPDGNMASLVEADGLGGQSGLGGQGGQGTAPEVEIDPTVFAYGFRSPWRGTRDSLGRVWVGDVGHQKFEEVNLVSEAGQNFGWTLYEGPCTTDCDGLTNPLTQFSRSADDPYVQDDPDASPATKRAMWLGDIYEAPPVDRYCGLMDGVVPFGDLFAGFVRGIRANAAGEVTFDQHLGHLGNVTSWRVGFDGYAYVLTLDGRLHRAVLAAPAE